MTYEDVCKKIADYMVFKWFIEYQKEKTLKEFLGLTDKQYKIFLDERTGKLLDNINAIEQEKK